MRILSAGKGRFLLTLGAGVVCLAAGGASVKTVAPALIPSQVALPGRWSASQFLQADAKGNVYLLRGDTLDVYSVDRGEVGKPKRLVLLMPPDSQPTAAAMSRDASSWALVASNRVFHFVDGRQQSTPEVGWFVTSVAMLRNTPIAGVLPMAVGEPRLEHPPSPPLVMRLEDHSWETFIPGKLPQRSQVHDSIDALFADHTVTLTTDDKGRMWAIYPFTGRIVRYTKTGRPDAGVVLGSGAAKHQDEAQQKRIVLANLKKQGYESSKATGGAFTAQLAIRGVTFGQDGTLYALLGSTLTGGKPALGRLSPVTASLETTPVRLPDDGEISMAAGREGLYFATLKGPSDVWQMSWRQLESAPWMEFAQVHYRGNLGADAP